MRTLAGRVVGLALLLACFHSPAWALPPHLDYETQTKTATGAGPSTDTALWTPVTGNRFILQGCVVNANNASITVELEVSDVDVIPPMQFESTGTQVVEMGGIPLYVSVEDAVLTYTVTGSGAWSILCVGYEEAVLD